MTRFNPPFIPTFYGFVEKIAEQSEDARASLEIIKLYPDSCTLFVGDERSKEWHGVEFTFVPLTVGNDMREINDWWKRWCGFRDYPANKGMRDATVALDLGVQLGFWMGFNPIYMLGCELTEDRRRGFEDVQRSRESAQVVAKMFAEAGLDLINLSEGCTAEMRTGDWREVLDGTS